jgi:threonine/homoserine/homoserine lactone efflux protein
MTLQLFFGLFVFAGIAAFTPGPNNALLMAAGMNYGFRRSVPMILGVVVGFPMMIGLVGLGLGGIFKVYPLLYTILKYAGAAYMLYLAWKIATSRPNNDTSIATKPLSFLQMCLFQWVNPKGWIMSVTALSAYTLADDYARGVATVVGTFFFMGLTSAITWTGFGSVLKNTMTDPRYFRIINFLLAVLLVASLVPLLWH